VEIKDQPAPDGGWGNVQALVREDLEVRERVGTERYGRPVQLFNGRDALVDAYQEAMDLTVYLRQAIAERDFASEQEALETADDLVPPKAMAAAQLACHGAKDIVDVARRGVFAAAPFIAAAAASRPPMDELPTPDTQLPSIPTYPLVAHLTGPTLDTLPITRTYWCVNPSCVHHGERITVQVLRIGHFVDMPMLRCRSCGCEPLSEALDSMAEPIGILGAK